MNSATILKKFSREKTSKLLVHKMHCSEKVAIYKSIKLGFLGMGGICIAQVVKMLYDGKVFDWLDWASIPFGLYSIIWYLIFTLWEIEASATKELINDLLAIRLNRSGRKS